MFSRASAATSILVSVVLLWPESAMAQATVQFSMPGLGLQTLIGWGVSIGAVLVGAVWGFRTILQKVGTPGKPKPNWRKIIPYRRIRQDNVTVLLKGATQLRVLEIGGINYAASSENQIEGAWRDRRRWFHALGELGVEVMVINDRGPIDVEIGGVLGNEWLQSVNNAWRQSFDSAMQNRSWVVLILRGKKGGPWDQLIGLLSGRRVDARLGGSLNDAVRVTEEILETHSVRLLTHEVDPTTGRSELWDFLQWNYSRDHDLGLPHDGEAFAHWMSGRVWFDATDAVIEQNNGKRTFCLSVVSLIHIEGETSERVTGNLMRLPFELTIYQHIKGYGKITAIKDIKERKTNAAGMFEVPVLSRKLDGIQEEIGSDLNGIARFEMTVFVYADSREVLKTRVMEVRKVLERESFSPHTEPVFFEHYWIKRFGGDPEFYRDYTLTWDQLADLTTVQASPKGQGSCWWGPRPLRTLRTVVGTPYELGIHQHGQPEALANTLLFGRPGSGKTVLAAWLMTGMLSHFEGARLFAFDNLNGLSVATRAFGGVVVSPGRGDDAMGAMIAPLQMPDTQANRTFLLRWLLELAVVDENDREAAQAAEVVLKLVMKLPEKERTLKLLYDEAVKKNNKFADGLARWIGDGQYAGWFDGETDAINLDVSNWITFDLQFMLPEPRVAAAFVAYLMHRIKREVWSHTNPSHDFHGRGRDAVCGIAPVF